jgi:thermitase
MISHRNRFLQRAVGALLLFVALASGRAARASASDSLYWQSNHVTADIKSSELLQVLEAISAATHWHVFVEPETFHTVSAKFKDLPPGDALHLLLGNVNFAVLPGTNSTQRLYVFRTSMQRATQLVRPTKGAAAAGQPKLMPNELIVRLKPGAKIEELAKLLGAKVIGRLDGLNAYRLQFEDQAATDAARQQLSSNADVASVEDNFTINPPEVAQPAQGTVPPIKLQLNPPPPNGQITLGLIDTAVQPLGDGLDQFIKKQEHLAGEPPAGSSTPLHGTSMAETMLRTLQLLGNGSTSINIQAYDIYGANQTANSWDLATALQKAVDGGANPISMSLGSTSDSPFVRQLVQEAISKGITVYAAVGNDGGPQMDYPAADAGATPVTALEKDGSIASYANKSGNKAIGAMGTVAVTFNGQTYLVSGTSPATAIVSATAASLMESTKGTAADVNKQLIANPTPTTVPGK